MQQTKGYFKVRGKIWGLANKEPYSNDYKRSLSFSIQSSKTNSNFIQVGDWKNSKLNVKIKSSSEGEVKEMSEQDAIDFVKENFKDGESVVINCRADVDTYHKRINFIANQIYKTTEDIDFDSEDFIEENDLSQIVVIIEKPTDKSVKVGVTTYKGEMIELELAIEDDIIKEYMSENAKVGDLMHVGIKVDNRPVYEDGDNSEPTKERTTLKGKKLGGSSNKKIKERNLVLVLDDIDTEKTESKKYERSEIREAIESAITKNNNDNAEDTSSIEDEETLPY